MLKLVDETVTVLIKKQTTNTIHGDLLAITRAVVTISSREIVVLGTVLLQQRVTARKVGSVTTGDCGYIPFQGIVHFLCVCGADCGLLTAQPLRGQGRICPAAS